MSTSLPTTYFEGEGRPFMEECVRRSADWCVAANIRSMVIFTGTGEGPQYAADHLLTDERYRHLHVVAVTPPFGRPYRSDPSNEGSPIVRAGVNPAKKDALSALGIVVVSAHLPFKEMYDGAQRSSAWSRVTEAYGVLGGGFALCVQAALIACDAGAIEQGDRVVVLSADTAFEALASRTESFLSPYEGLIVRHVICRPMSYLISKRSHYAFAPAAPVAPAGATAQPLALLEGRRESMIGTTTVIDSTGAPALRRRKKRRVVKKAR